MLPPRHVLESARYTRYACFCATGFEIAQRGMRAWRDAVRAVRVMEETPAAAQRLMPLCYGCCRSDSVQRAAALPARTRCAGSTLYGVDGRASRGV